MTKRKSLICKKVAGALLIMGIVMNYPALAQLPEKPNNPTDTEAWQNINADGYFTFKIPPDMKEIPVQGIDSYVGEYQGPTTQLQFDYGLYSGFLKEYSRKPDYKKTSLNVHGRKAKLITFYNEETTLEFPYVIAIHFPDLGIQSEEGKTTLVVWVNCKTPEDYSVAERILKSIQFP